MVRVAIGVFLVAHGLIHAAIWLPQAFGVRASSDPASPFDPGYSWLFSGFSDGGARWLSVLLALVAALAFVAAGVGLFAHQGWWRTLTVGASAVSLALFLFYFNPWLSLAVPIDVALLWALLWAHWPSVEQVGA
jgi:hypothetical protein